MSSRSTATGSLQGKLMVRISKPGLELPRANNEQPDSERPIINEDGRRFWTGVMDLACPLMLGRVLSEQYSGESLPIKPQDGDIGPASSEFRKA